VTRELSAAIVFAILGLALALMLVGWLRRRRSQRGIAGFADVPDDLGAVLDEAEVLYLATTRPGAPYDRIAVHGLGFRSRGAMTVAERGILLDLAGSPRRFLPAADLRGVGRATWTIDRVVETDGLLLVGWRLGDEQLDSYFRADAPAALVAAISRIVPVDPNPAEQKEEAA
jgi:hypothetical protein